MSYVILILAIAALAVGRYFYAQGKKKLLEKGKIMERESKFYTKKEILFADVPYQTVRDAILFELYGDDAQRITPGGENISSGRKDIMGDQTDERIRKSIEMSEDAARKTMYFKGGSWRYSWSAAFLQVEERPEGNTFEFGFNSWRTRDGVNDETGMNYLLTSVEKAFLRCDIDTVFELREESYKTKYI